MDLRDLAQAAEVLQPVAVPDAARQQAQRQVPAAVLAFDPAEAVAVVIETKGARRRQRESGAPLHLGFEPAEPAIVDGVFQPRTLAHHAVAEIALRGHHRGRQRNDLVRRDEADHVADARIGLGIAMAGAHAAADADVVAAQFTGFDHGDEAQVLGEHIHVVHRRNGEADLELARQVAVAVDRLGFLAAAGDLLFVQPDLVIGAGVGQQVLGQRRRLRVDRGVLARLQRIGGDHHIAIDVAAGGQRVQQGRVDRLHGRLQFAP